LSKDKKILKAYANKNMPLYLIAIAAVIMGVIIGSASVGRLDEADAQTLYQSIISSTVNIKAQSTFAKSLFQNAKSVIIFWILGMTVIGTAPMVIAVGAKGYAVGFTVGFLVKYYGLTGFLASVSGVLPHNIIILPCYILLAAAGMNFSQKLLMGTGNIKVSFVSYSALTAILFGIISIGSVVEGYVSSSLIKAALGIITRQ